MKPWFTGEEEPPRHRVCTCQKCIRTGDIENIGKTARHGTYFEMLGNFSFGDYFKREAIHWCLGVPDLSRSGWAWSRTGCIPPCSPAMRHPRRRRGLRHLEQGRSASPSDRIFRFGKEDNFWEHGSGPCGPCSEIYYDRGPE